MILLIDNYDSFVHNLARYVRELGGTAVVCRHNQVTLADIANRPGDLLRIFGKQTHSS